MRGGGLESVGRWGRGGRRGTWWRRQEGGGWLVSNSHIGENTRGGEVDKWCLRHPDVPVPRPGHGPGGEDWGGGQGGAGELSGCLSGQCAMG